MAHTAWVTTGTKWCERASSEANMMEKRIYPSEIMPDFPGHRVAARKCSLSISCNLQGFPCKWAYTEASEESF